METLIYWLLFHNNAQALQDLDNYQKKCHGVHISKPDTPKQQDVIVECEVEDVEEIDKIMRKRPKGETAR